MERPSSRPESEPIEERAGGPEGPDLVSIGLALYFVSLILVVGALLLLPIAL